MKKTIFISHPYSNNPTVNKIKEDMICKELLKFNYVPVSPLHMFSFYEDEIDREEILNICKHTIIGCDEVWVFGFSTGCIVEMEYARHINKLIKVFKSMEEFKAYLNNEHYKNETVKIDDITIDDLIRDIVKEKYDDFVIDEVKVNLKVKSK